MEKTIKFEDVIAFIRKAMNDGLEIHKDLNGLTICTNSTPSGIFSFGFTLDKCYISTPTAYLTIDITEKEYNLYKVVLDTVKDYIHDVGIKEFMDFFKDDENRVKDIDDLDDDDK